MSSTSLYKTNIFKISDIYVSILVSLVILSYILWYINDRQYALLYHPMNTKISIQIIDSKRLIKTMFELWLFIFHSIKKFPPELLCIIKC